MKKFIVFFAILSVLFVVAACFDSRVTDGNLTYNVSDYEVSLCEYDWDGTEEGRVINVPAYIDGKEVTSIGGYSGSSTPTHLVVDIKDAFEDVNEWCIGSSFYDVVDEVTIDFDLVTSIARENIELGPNKYYREVEGGIIVYNVNVNIVNA